MFWKSFINNEYRQQAPDAESTGGGGDAPAPEPEATAPEAEATTPDPTPPKDEGQDIIPSEEEESLWDQLSRDEDDDILPDEDSPEPEPSAQPEAKPEETPPETPPAEEDDKGPAETPAEQAKPEAEAEAKPTEPEKPAEQPTTTPESEPTPVDPQAAEEAFKKEKADLTEKLVDYYKLSDAEALQLATDPAKILPQLQARMFTDMWFGVREMMKQALPELIRQNVRETQVQDEKVEGFFKAWPQLNAKDHGATIAKVSKVFAQVNPNATEEEITKYVGLQVMMHHGLIPEQYQGETTTPAAPETPAPAAVTPHRPAAVNSARAEQTSPANIWEGMAEEMLEDD